MAAAVDVSSSALDGVVVQVVQDDLAAFVQEVESEPEGHKEAMAGERVRTRSQLTSSGSAGERPPSHRQKGLDGELVREEGATVPGRVYAPLKKQKKRGKGRVFEHKPIRLMRGRPTYDFVDAFRKAPVTDLTWGSLMDIAPVIRRDVAHQLVQERMKRLVPKDKGKQVEAALVAEEPQNEGNDSEVLNFYTTARATVGAKVFNLNHVLVDAGSVINLAPITVLKRIGAHLQQTKDLIIRTATSTLVTIDWFADLTAEVASVSTPIRVYAIPGDCRPTFAMLLSRRWLRACEAIGDYLAGTYVIKDSLGCRHMVPREDRGNRNLPPKVHLNPSNANVDLEDEVIAELELDTFNATSVRRLASRIAREVDSELNTYEQYFGDYDRTNSMPDGTSSEAASSATDSYYDEDGGSDNDSENWSSW